MLIRRKKSLAYTLKQILDELPYGPAPDFKITANPKFHSSLVEAIQLYGTSREEALALLYKKKDLSATRPMEMEADFEEVAASCGHFSFSLQDFAEDIKNYLEILDDLKLETDHSPRRRSWTWLKFWRDKKGSKQSSQMADPGSLCSFMSKKYTNNNKKAIASWPGMMKPIFPVKYPAR